VKSYVINTINLSCAKILLTSVISRQKEQKTFTIIRRDTCKWTLWCRNCVHAECSLGSLDERSQFTC